jgi:hypothetical protein
MHTLDRNRLKTLLATEEMKFRREHPKSYDLYIRARQCFG